MQIGCLIDLTIEELASDIVSRNSLDDLLSFIAAIDLYVADCDFTEELISTLQQSLDEENWEE